MKKSTKIIIGVIVIIILIAIAAVALMPKSNEIQFEQITFKVSDNYVVDNNTTNHTAHTKNNSCYIVYAQENETNASDLSSTFNDIKSLSSQVAEITGSNDTLGFYNFINYTLNNSISVYEFSTNNGTYIKECVDTFDTTGYNNARICFFIIPGETQVYSIAFISNDSSTDLYSADINETIDSVHITA